MNVFQKFAIESVERELPNEPLPKSSPCEEPEHVVSGLESWGRFGRQIEYEIRQLVDGMFFPTEPRSQDQTACSPTLEMAVDENRHNG